MLTTVLLEQLAYAFSKTQELGKLKLTAVISHKENNFNYVSRCCNATGTKVAVDPIKLILRKQAVSDKTPSCKYWQADSQQQFQ